MYKELCHKLIDELINYEFVVDHEGWESEYDITSVLQLLVNLKYGEEFRIALFKKPSA